MKQNHAKIRYRLTLLPMGIILQSDEGRTIMEVLADSDIAMRSDCGGLGRCGKCLVSVHPAAKSAPDREISVTAKDIRQVQLAKAALTAGIELLKRRSGLTQIERVVLTGAFGTTFNPESASIVGILPQEIAFERLEVIPNAAGLGAVRALLDKNRQQEIESFYPKIEALELATDPDFSTMFVEIVPFAQPSEGAAKEEKEWILKTLPRMKHWM